MVSREAQQDWIKCVPSAKADGFIFLACPRKTEPERRTPQESRPADILSSGCAFALRAFFTAHPCAGKNVADIVSATLRADPPRDRRDSGDPNSCGLLPSKADKALRQKRCSVDDTLSHRPIAGYKTRPDPAPIGTSYCGLAAPSCEIRSSDIGATEKPFG